MKPPASNKGAPNPYARRTPWGRVQAAPFTLGVGPGSAPISDEPRPPKAPPMRQPRSGALPGPGEGILGGSPLMPARAPGPASPLMQPPEAKATPVRTSKPVPTPKSAPAPAMVAPVATPAPPPPVAPPPSEIIERLSRIEEPAAPVGRRLLIAGVALGVIVLIGVAAMMLARRDAGIEDTVPETAAVAPPAGQPAPAATTASPPDALPGAPPIYRATLPPAVTSGTASPPAGPPPRTTVDAAPPPPAVPPTVLVTPDPVVLPPVVEAPAPRPTPPLAAAPKPAADPDAPFVLRKGED